MANKTSSNTKRSYHENMNLSEYARHRQSIPTNGKALIGCVIDAPHCTVVGENQYCVL